MWKDVKKKNDELDILPAIGCSRKVLAPLIRYGLILGYIM